MSMWHTCTVNTSLIGPSLFYQIHVSLCMCPLCFNVYTRWNATNIPGYLFFFPWRWPLYSTSGPTEAVLFKTMLCWSKRAIFNVSLREVFCFWRGGGVCLCELFSLSPLTFINPTCSSCCTQLYYQSNGHVVHCMILYIESILLNVF